MRDLEGAHQTLVEQLVGRKAGDILATEADLARHRRKCTCNEIEECGLASAIGTDQACDRAFLHLEGTVINSRKAAKLHDKLVEFQHLFFPAAAIGSALIVSFCAPYQVSLTLPRAYAGQP